MLKKIRDIKIQISPNFLTFFEFVLQKVRNNSKLKKKVLKLRGHQIENSEMSKKCGFLPIVSISKSFLANNPCPPCGTFESAT